MNIQKEKVKKKMKILIILYIINFAIYTTLQERTKSHFITQTIMFIITYHATFWIFIIFFEIIERNKYFEKYKIKTKKTQISYNKILKTVLRNQIFQMILIVYLLNYYSSFCNSEVYFFNSLFWSLVYYMLYDLIIYFGHLFMHKNKWVYNNIHFLHHQTFSDKGFHYFNNIRFTLF
jgi:hypothetical protein